MVDPLAGHAHGTDDLAGVSMLTYSNYGPKIIADALTQYSFKTIIQMSTLPMTASLKPVKIASWNENVFGRRQRPTLWQTGDVGEVTATRQIQFRWVKQRLDGCCSGRLTEPTGSKLDLEYKTSITLASTLLTVTVQHGSMPVG